VGEPLRILHNVWKVGPASFGLGPVVSNLSMGQSALGHEPWICSFDSSAELPESLGGDIQIRNFADPRAGRLGFCPSMLGWAARQGGSFDLVHQHSLWTGNSRLTNLLRRRFGLPTVVAPHGALTCRALRRSWYKKWLAMLWYERENLFGSSCLHALSPKEIEDFRHFGFRGPVAVIPNGVSADWLEGRGSGDAFRCRHSLSADKRILLFLSRITPIKGLGNFLQGMKRVERRLQDWILVVAGADEFNHRREMEKLVQSLGLSEKVHFVGPLWGQDKRDAFSAADLFVLPSLSEGAPLVILEALGAGVPVLATKASPWEELVRMDCGWWADSTPASLADALGDAVARPAEVLSLMGAKGRQLVKEKYSWDHSAAKTIALYSWLLGKGPRPSFVYTD